MSIFRKNFAIFLALALFFTLSACMPGDSDTDGLASGGASAEIVNGAADEADGGAAQGNAGGAATGSVNGAPAASDSPSLTASPNPPGTSSGQSSGGSSASPSGSSPTPGHSSSLEPSPSIEPSSPTEPPASGPSMSPSPTPDPAASPSPSPATPDGPVVLTIRGDGVSAETAWTLGGLQAMRDGYREYVYSTTNNWPTFGHMTAHGVSLTYLLRQAGMLSSASGFRLTASDGYYAIVTYEQVFGTSYSYSTHGPGGSGGASVVEPVIAWAWGDGAARQENPRSFFGQRGPMDVNTSSFVQDIVLIEVLTVPPGVWAAPAASIADGSEVTYGAELTLMHDQMDSLKIYYTTDGSEPDYNSRVYNGSTSYFQPHLIAPLYLVEDVTVRAFAAGYGRDASPVVTFTYTVVDP